MVCAHRRFTRLMNGAREFLGVQLAEKDGKILFFAWEVTQDQ